MGMRFYVVAIAFFNLPDHSVTHMRSPTHLIAVEPVMRLARE